MYINSQCTLIRHLKSNKAAYINQPLGTIRCNKAWQKCCSTSPWLSILFYTTLSWPMGKWHKLAHTSNNAIKKINTCLIGTNKYYVEKKREFSSKLRVLNLLTSTNCYKIFNHSDSFVWYCEKCQMNVNNFDTFWKIHMCQKNPYWTLSCMITYTNQHRST